MKVIWQVGKGFVKDFLEVFPDPKPHYNTLSSLVRILEDKGFVGHKAYGKTHEYFPLISQDAYQTAYLSRIVDGYFGSSYKNVVSFFAENENISVDELKEIINMIEKGKS